MEPEWNYVVRPWVARVARAAAGHVLAGVEGRFDASESSASRATLAGHALSPGGDMAARARAPAVLAVAPAEGATIEFRELLGGSSFNLASPPPDLTEGAGGEERGRWALWGRGDWTRFTGEEPDLMLDGSVITGTLGADFSRGRVLAGLASPTPRPAVPSRPTRATRATCPARCSACIPYLRLGLQERLAVWGLLGFGVFGELSLDPAGAPAVTAELAC